MPNFDDSLPPNGPTIRRAFETLTAALQERGIRHAFIGGLAVTQHTRVRTTDDIDVLLVLPQVSLPGFLDELGRRGFTIDPLRNIRELRDDGLTTVRYADVVVDLLRPVIPAMAHVLDRAVSSEILGQIVPVSTAEGLIVMKLMAMRPQDEADIRELLAAYGASLDVTFIRHELATFTQPDDPRRAKFESWVGELCS